MGELFSSYYKGGIVKVLENYGVSIDIDGTVKRLDNGKVYTASPDKFGYPRLYLVDKVSGKRKGLYLHRLLAQAYIPNPEGKRCVNHLDGDKTNFSLDNLQWCTHKENTQHAIKEGLFMAGSYTVSKQKVFYALQNTGKFTGQELEQLMSEL